MQFLLPVIYVVLEIKYQLTLTEHFVNVISISSLYLCISGHITGFENKMVIICLIPVYRWQVLENLDGFQVSVIQR